MRATAIGIGASVAISIFLCIAFASALYRLVVLRARVTLAEEQTQMFEECRASALTSTDPLKIIALMEGVVIYYPSGTKQAPGSHLDSIVERSRHWAIEDMTARYRALTGTNPPPILGTHPSNASVQPSGPANRR